MEILIIAYSFNGASNIKWNWKLDRGLFSTMPAEAPEWFIKWGHE